MFIVREHKCGIQHGLLIGHNKCNAGCKSISRTTNPVGLKYSRITHLEVGTKERRKRTLEIQQYAGMDPSAKQLSVTPIVGPVSLLLLLIVVQSFGKREKVGGI